MAVCAGDNLSGSDGDNSEHVSLVDDRSNTWTKLKEFTNAQAGAATGVTASIWMTQIATQVETTDNITLTFSSAITAKTLRVARFTVAAGKTFSLVGSASGAADASLTGSNLTISSLANAEHLFLHLAGIEGPSADVYTSPTNYTASVQGGNNAGGAATNIVANSSFRILTATTDSAQGSNDTARDWASVYVAVDEVDPPASGNDPFPYVGGGYFPTQG